MKVKVRVVHEHVVEVDYDGRRTTKDELQQLFEQGELSVNGQFAYMDGKSYTITPVDVTRIQGVEILR